MFHVTHNDKILFSGTFSECWKYMCANYGNGTLESIFDKGIRIQKVA